MRHLIRAKLVLLTAGRAVLAVPLFAADIFLPAVATAFVRGAASQI